MGIKDSTKDCQCIQWQSKKDTIFFGLSPDTLAYIDQIKHCHTYKKGENIFKEGANCGGLYWVYKGKIKLIQLGSDGKEQILHLAKAGSMMGYRALIGQDPFSCSAVALENTHVCFLLREPLIHIMQKHPSMLMKIAQQLSEDLKESEHKITTTAQQSAKAKLAQAILFLKTNYGLNEDKSINAKINREELANLAGIARETTTRLLYQLQDNGIIALSKKNIILVSELKLTQLIKF